MLSVGSLFSGIGGFDLGLERAGMRTAWFCEADAFCQRVLAKHWPGVPCYPDIRKLWRPAPVDLLCGGFPCQDLSPIGKQAGLHGERSRLWFEFLRLIGELRPRYVVVENVPRLRKYLGIICGGLAEIGYDAEWDVISARDVGAPHLRRRLWLVAYPTRDVWPVQAQGRSERQRAGPGRLESGAGADMAHATGLSGRSRDEEAQYTRAHRDQLSDGGPQGHAWSVEPDVGRVAHGIPARVDRLRSLGNALVPQIAEWIGQRIIVYEEGRLAA